MFRKLGNRIPQGNGWVIWDQKMSRPWLTRGLSSVCYWDGWTRSFRKPRKEVTKENKRDLDRVIHGIVGVEHKNCPTAWREVKKRLARNPEAFISELRKEWNKRI